MSDSSADAVPRPYAFFLTIAGSPAHPLPSRRKTMVTDRIEIERGIAPGALFDLILEAVDNAADEAGIEIPETLQITRIDNVKGEACEVPELLQDLVNLLGGDK